MPGELCAVTMAFLSQCSDETTGWIFKESWFNSLQGKKFLQVARPAERATQPAFQWVPSEGGGGSGGTTKITNNLVLRLRMNEDVPSLPLVP